jgi:3-oxoacyl-[acyl-carrier-protein] synthase III
VIGKAGTDTGYPSRYLDGEYSAAAMRSLRSSTITGWGHYAPEKVLTNHDLEKIVDTSDEWIQSRSGIRERHVASPDDQTSTLSARAGERALHRAGVSAQDIDLILVASSSPDYLTPPVSSQVQHLLGANHAGAMTLVVGCTGFVYALVSAHQFIATGAADTVLVIGAEIASRNLDWTDRNTCVLFGDGAGAVVMQASENGGGVLSFVLGSDGGGAEHLIQPSGGTRFPPTPERLEKGENYLQMNGREVFKFATHRMVESLMQVMEDAGLGADDIDLFIPHQANARIIEYAVRKSGLPPEKVVVNVDRYGNTSAASIPIALSEAMDEGRAGPGSTLAFVGFGAGLTWAACLYQLSAEVPSPQRESHAVEGMIA